MAFLGLVGVSRFLRLYRVISYKIVIVSRVKRYSIIARVNLNSSRSNLTEEKIVISLLKILEALLLTLFRLCLYIYRY